VVALKKVENVEGLGIVEMKNEKILKIIEKPRRPKDNLVNAGIYIFTPEIFDAIDKTKLSLRGEYEITDSIQILLKKSPVYGYVITDDWIDIGRPWDLLDANEILQKNIHHQIKGEIEEFATIRGNVQIGEHTIVRNGSYIIGPTIIGKNCEIGPNCLIRPSTFIDDGCKIGNSVEIKNSIILANTDIPHLSYVGDSIIGERCNLGAGTKIANLRLDERDISVILKGEKMSTNRRKLGAVIGDDVKIGINVSIDVGTIIGEETFIGPNAVVSGTVAPKSRIY
jgi:bifunctional UDP-N-acetylglucosamine pyrophosphorylase/glucosamine-1-phosphate N-acetyltransferase